MRLTCFTGTKVLFKITNEKSNYMLKVNTKKKYISERL